MYLVFRYILLVSLYFVNTKFAKVLLLITYAFFYITAFHHKDKTERSLKILIYQTIMVLYGLVTFACRPSRAIFYIDLETLQYLNNKDTSLKSLNVYPTIKKYFYNITPVYRVLPLWRGSYFLGGPDVFCFFVIFAKTAQAIFFKIGVLIKCHNLLVVYKFKSD